MFMSNGKIIVSMTSYPKRITNVGKSIFLLLTRQSVVPDEIHLWLSIEEFPKLEDSLPADLRAVLNHESVYLHWVKKNTYVHKRHEIFNIVDENDLVFFVDDDVKYSDNLISTVLKTHKRFPNCIICYNRYALHKYRGRHIIYGKRVGDSYPQVNRVRWCGQSMIPAKLYPRVILGESYKSVRDRTSPISDECWFQPWTVFYDIPIYHLNFGWGSNICKDIDHNKGLCVSTHYTDSNGLERRDNWLHAVLEAYPDILEKYRRLFNYECDSY